MNIYPNAYYNYRKHRKSVYDTKKSEVLKQIEEIYHEHNGVTGYRNMQAYLSRRGIYYSRLTVHKYMNGELKLKSIVRPKRPAWQRGKAHKVFENKFQQNFDADSKNRKWCTDFTYLFLKDGQVRYNCTIIDLYDRSVVASLTDRKITSELAIKTLQKALETQSVKSGEVTLHSDQGVQYTSKAFTEFCEEKGVKQSMSRAGCPYDNAPMERYFNTLKNECINLHRYHDENELYRAIEEFAYVEYNHSRPHSHNDYRTPADVRLKGK